MISLEFRKQDTAKIDKDINKSHLHWMTGVKVI